ncbi:HET-R [Fusarium solani]|uniref:HET-R n=1 Tax=Fusarium solani TaxID=169388 RepID=A0A9P9R7A7_FUSSL|nr:HET-R [Fusarium solani]KAH7268477.1 HET-R [Fusarium solani]
MPVDASAEHPGGSADSIVFSADGQRLAAGFHDGTIGMWEAATGAFPEIFEVHDGAVNSVVFSADSQQIASGSYDRTMKSRLASASHDGTIKVWDAATGICLQMLNGHGAWVHSVVFSADSQRLVSGSGDGTIEVWDVAMGACLQTLQVGISATHLLSDLAINSRLAAETGLTNLDLLPGSNNRLAEVVSRDVIHSGYGTNPDGRWIEKDGEKMLWLHQVIDRRNRLWWN